VFALLSTTVALAQNDHEAGGVIRCATDEREAIRQANSDQYRRDRLEFENRIENYRAARHVTARVAADEVIRIPVVVHVIHNQADNKIGGSGNTNISEEQIRSQIVVLNEDYRRKPGTNGFNTNAVGADAKIEFELAQYDPSGHQGSGITRTYSKTTQFSPYTDDVVLAKLISWPSDKYLNIWVCPLNNVFLGVAQLPSVSSFDGLDNKRKDQADTDGVIIDYRYFGSVQNQVNTGSITTKTYNLGRTTSHEVGHWLGLLHTWGVTDGVCGTDYCSDTPPAKSGNLAFDCTPKTVQCSGVTSQVMIENYMDYSADVCMNIFTQGQVERMNRVLAVSPRRIALLKAIKEGRIDESDKLTVELFPNPTDGELFAKVRFKAYQSFSLLVYDLGGVLRSEIKFIDVWSRQVSIETEKLLPGMYICKVSTGSETVSRRFVVK
jgi:hypothetical protein